MPDTTIGQNASAKFELFKVSKRRSCELVDTPSPCVNKALYHLERLKRLTKLPSPTSLQTLDEDNFPKKQLRFSLEEISDFVDTSSDQIQNEFALVNEDPQSSFVQDKDSETFLSKIQLSPNEVFIQVASLIMRLEKDRNSTQRALDLEKKKVNSLIVKIDELARRRLIQLPEIVQKEHDACATDIIELEWHVARTERDLERSRAKLKSAQLLNTSLKEDIDFVKEHCPLVEEKLESEKEAMETIKAMQKATDDELAEAQWLQKEAEEKYQSAVERANAEREKIRKELDGARHQLGMLKKDYTHAKSLHDAYLKKADESREKLAQQDEEIAALEQKIEDVKEQEQLEYAKIEDLRELIRQVEFETGEYTKKKKQLQEDLEQLKSSMESQLAKLELTYKENLRNLRNIQENNRDLKYDIEDMKGEIKNNEKAIAKNERELARYQQERDKMEKQLKVANDDVANISMVNSELKNQLEKEEAKSQALEEALKETAENLRKQVNNEMKQRAALEAKRQQNSKALLKGKSENIKKKQMIEKTLEEAMQAVLKATEEVKKLQEEHDATVVVIVDLEKKLTEVNTEHAMVESDLTKKKQEIEPVEAKLQEEQLHLRERISELKFEESQLERKLKELEVAQTTLKKRYNATSQSIDQLKDEFDELKIQLSNGDDTNTALRSQLDEALARMSEREKIHLSLMKEREEIKERLEKKVKEELEYNEEIAAKYRTLQYEHLDLKNRLMSLYDSKVKMETTIKDHKQLLSLQGKLNIALEEYYKNRSDFNKAGLNKFKMMSMTSSSMMTEVQKGLEVAIENVSAFLQNQADGSAAEEVHQAAMSCLGLSCPT